MADGIPPGGPMVRWHPLPALLYIGGVVIFSLTLLHPLYLAAAVAATAGLWRRVGHGMGSRRRRAIRGYLLFAVIVMSANPLFSHRGATILGYLFDQPITLEAAAYGILMALSLLAVLFAFQVFNIIVPGERLLFLLGGIMPRMALVLQMAVASVPRLLDRWRSVRAVQASQGIDAGRGGIRDRAAAIMDQTTILLAWSLEQAVVTARSMRARGYGAGSRRTRYRPHELRREDWLTMVWLTIIGAALLWGRQAGFGEFTVYPRLQPVKEFLHWPPGEWMLLGLFCLYLLTPLYREGKVAVSWQLWRWRTSRFATRGPLPPH